MSWYKEPRRHSLARRGVKTATKDVQDRVVIKQKNNSCSKCGTQNAVFGKLCESCFIKRGVRREKSRKIIDENFKSAKLSLNNSSYPNYENNLFGKGFDMSKEVVNDYYYDKKLVEMTPDEFMYETYKEYLEYKKYSKDKKVMSFEEYKKDVIFEDTIDKIAKDKDKKMPIPFIEKNKEGINESHEGRHRAELSRRLGYKKIPVYIITRKRF